jgi:hydroxyethylthiazole kinase
VAVNPKDSFMATVSAMALMGVAGQIAAEKSNGRPGILQINFLDALYQLSEEEFLNMVRIS